MVTQEGAPSLGGQPGSLDYAVRDAGLSDFKAKFEQLAMDTGGAPQWIVSAHPPDQRTQVRVDLRSTSKGAGFPLPISPEAGPVPVHKGLRPDDRDGLEDRWEPSIQHDQEQAIPIRELDATTHPPLQHTQLMSECRVLCLKSALRLERRGEQGEEEAEQRDYRVRRFGPVINQDEVFGTHSGHSNHRMAYKAPLVSGTGKSCPNVQHGVHEQRKLHL